MKNHFKFLFLALTVIVLSSCFSSKKQNCNAYGKLEIKKDTTPTSDVNAKLTTEEIQNS